MMRARHLFPPCLLVAFLAVSAVTAQEDPTSSYPAQLANPYLPAEQREAAALWLAALKDRSNLDLLIQVLPDPDKRVRRAVILALERIGDPAAVPALISRLLDHECYYQVQRALDRLDASWRQRPEARSLFESLAHGFPASCKWSLPGLQRPPWFALEPLTILDPDGTAALFTNALLNGKLPDRFITKEMIDYLGERKWAAAKPALLFCLEYRTEIADDAADALGAIDQEWPESEEAVQLARRLLARYQQVPNKKTREAFYEIAVRIPLPEALPLLTRDLASAEKADQQRSAIRAIGRVADPRASAVLRTHLRVPSLNREMARECLLAIADYRDDDARQTLLQVLRDTHRDDEVRELAARLLLDFGQVGDLEAVIEEATARRDSQSLRVDLLGALVTGTKNVARGRFAGEVIDDVELSLVRGRSCVRKLERQACDRGEAREVRERSVTVLRGVQDPSSFNSLLSVASERAEGELREEAIRAMADVDQSRAAHAFWRLLEERSSGLPIIFMAWTLTGEGEQATHRLADRFADLPEVQDTLVRRGRASLLPRDKAVEAIKRLLGQDQWEHFYGTLISQWVDLDADNAVLALSQHKSSVVRAWVAYAAFQKQVRNGRPDASTGKEQEER